MADIPDNPVDINIEEITQDISKALSHVEWQTWGTAAIYVLFGFLVASFISTAIGRILAKYTSAHYTQIIKRLLYYGIITVSILIALATLQLNMKVLGIATILTLAIGFASQTAVSNIITGLFLVFERPFLVGDYLDVNGVLGELLSIDLLSIKIRTFDNTLVRIPNEILIKEKFINMTKFPIRRLDTKIRIDLNEDLDKVRKLLFDLARKNPLVLESPPAQLLFEEFTESAIIFKLAVWIKKESFYALKHQIPCDIQQTLKEHGIKMPIMRVQVDKQTS
mgnify:FL=1